MTARAATAKPRPGDAIVDRLREEIGVRGVLVQMAKRGQIIELRCEMPSCYGHKGRAHFDPKSHPPGPWELSPDHYPRLKSDGGHLDPWNVRLSHVLCNREDYVWRMRIRRMLEKGKALDEIAKNLNERASGLRMAGAGGRPPPFGKRSSHDPASRAKHQSASTREATPGAAIRAGGNLRRSQSAREHGVDARLELYSADGRLFKCSGRFSFWRRRRSPLAGGSSATSYRSLAARSSAG